MLFLTKWFGITGSDAERNLAREKSEIEEIVEKSLLLQKNAAAQQHRPLCRGTHAKGVCARAEFEVLDVAPGRDPVLAARLAKGIFRRPGVYSATVRFGNADPKINSDFKPDVRSLSFSVDLTRDGTAARGATVGRQDFSLQNTKTLPINDATAFLAIMKLLTAPNPAVGLWSLPFRDKLRKQKRLSTRSRGLPCYGIRSFSQLPAKRHISMSLGTRRPTARRLGALIVPAGPRRLPAEKHAPMRIAIVKQRR